MPHYHFNTHDGKDFTDKEGTELPDLRTARSEAVQLMGNLIADQPDEILATKRFMVTVANDAGRTLFVLDLSAHDAAESAPAAC